MAISREHQELNPFREGSSGDDFSFENPSSSKDSSDDASVSDVQDSPSARESIDSTKKQEFSERVRIENKIKRSGFNDLRVKNLLLMLARAYRRRQARLHAHRAFHEHVNKLKDDLVSKKPVKEEVVHENIAELKNRVSYLLEVEKNPDYTAENKELKNKLLSMESKLNMLMKTKEEKEERFKKLEAKINAKLNNDKQIVDELERKLLVLQRKMIEYKLNNKAKMNSSSLKEIDERIKLTKSAIDRIKKSS
jgi:hypothetical protein